MQLQGLAKKLVQEGLLDEEKALLALQTSQKDKKPFVSIIVQQKLIDALKLASFLSNHYGLPLISLSDLDTQAIPKNTIKADAAIELHAVPIFKRGNRLFVAISDPTNIKALDEIKYLTNTSVDALLASEIDLTEFIEKVLSLQDTAFLGKISDSDLENLEVGAEEEFNNLTTTIDKDDAPVVRFINKILLDAVHAGASDIHFEPFENTYRIRLRLDGLLYEYAAPPPNLGPRLSTRLKVISRLDISERRLPQDGRFKLKLSHHHNIDFRVSTCPTMYGEKIVIRILDSHSAKLNLENLGMEDFQKNLFKDNLFRPQGMILVTGPTGSGKTLTLYTALNLLNTIERNISSCEDPVEINLPGVNQININVKIGLTFATALRAFLRQDPDVIMVGEIRDLETAEIAIKAAQTGHLVLSTLHTNSAPDTLSRLINMGIPTYNLATSINLVIAQRLARKLCSYCKEPIQIPEHALLEAGFDNNKLPNALYKAKGCEKCKNGYKGRIGIFEMMPITPSISQIIMEGGSAIAIAKQATADNIWSLRKAGLHKVELGLTTIEEIDRISKES